jgi:hypothetical protein
VTTVLVVDSRIIGNLGTEHTDRVEVRVILCMVPGRLIRQGFAKDCTEGIFAYGAKSTVRLVMLAYAREVTLVCAGEGERDRYLFRET